MNIGKHTFTKNLRHHKCEKQEWKILDCECVVNKIYDAGSTVIQCGAKNGFETSFNREC